MDAQMPDELETNLFIGGEFRPGSDGGRLATVDPATHEQLGEAASATPVDVADAVALARAASEEWAALPPRVRGEALTRLGDGILAASEELARIESLDTGKPLTQSRADVSTCAEYFRYYGSVVDKYFGEAVDVGPDDLGVVLREPLGVVAHITPWNYPLQVLGRSVAPALAAGNVSLVKPAEEAPLSTLQLGHLAQAANVPPGVLSVLTGPGEVVGAALAGSPDVDHVVFTGSVATGSLVMAAASRNLTSVTMELGGKSPAVVCADADLDAMVPMVAKGLLQNAGQSCSACTRVIAEESVYEEVLERLSAAFGSARLGHGVDDPDVGPLISEQQYAGVQRTVDETVAAGARLVCGGGRAEVGGLPGHFLSPTILADVDPASDAAREEIFGPVLVAMPFDGSIAEAARLADATPYGLVASIWTSSFDKAMSFARRVHSGQVFVNSYGVGGGIALPFGGFKKSGFGREKGVEAMREYTQAKTVILHSRAL
jgi:aldehyde dehydrogenase (NAD+)